MNAREQSRRPRKGALRSRSPSPVSRTIGLSSRVARSRLPRWPLPSSAAALSTSYFPALSLIIPTLSFFLLSILCPSQFHSNLATPVPVRAGPPHSTSRAQQQSTIHGLVWPPSKHPYPSGRPSERQDSSERDGSSPLPATNPSALLSQHAHTPLVCLFGSIPGCLASGPDKRSVLPFARPTSRPFSRGD